MTRGSNEPSAPTAEELFARPFGTLEQLVTAHASQRPGHPAVVDAEGSLDYSGFDALVSRVAAALRRDGVGKGGVAAICAASSSAYVAAFVGTLRAGAAVAPLAPSATAESLAAMLIDCGATIVFLDAASAELLAPVASRISAKRVALDGSASGAPFATWLAAEGAAVVDPEVGPDDPFNIIYSSGTTGTPKGIVQPHAMRWNQVSRLVFGADAVTLASTPLYSNTTLVSVLPTLGAGGTLVLMAKFEAGAFLGLAARHGVTHAMLVPVQYRRIMERPDFDSYDLSRFKVKFSTSAPFAPDLMADVLKRWPGGLVEFYGMTEGGGSCMLAAHEHPDKLHTVGQPMAEHDIRLIDEDGREVAPGGTGEVVGRSPSMMVGYHNLPEKSREAEWISPEGLRFIRTGDVGRFDDDGFLVLLDRRKDMIISGGFNIYPSDLEAVLARHPEIDESAVIGAPSELWGETPVAFVRLREGALADAPSIMAFANAQVGKTQRLADVRIVPALPRSAIGKVLKRELRDAYVSGGGRHAR